MAYMVLAKKVFYCGFSSWLFCDKLTNAPDVRDNCSYKTAWPQALHVRFVRQYYSAAS